MPFSDTLLNREGLREDPLEGDSRKRREGVSGLPWVVLLQSKNMEEATRKEAQETFAVIGGILSTMLKTPQIVASGALRVTIHFRPVRVSR